MNVPRREYTANAIGHAVRAVKCESCQAEYVYVLKCEGTGYGTSLLFLDNRGAEERADKAAVSDLEDKLANAVDGVPCPKCGWYQANMVTHILTEWGGGLGFAGIAAIALGLFGLFFCAILGYVVWVGPGPPGEGPTLPQIGAAAIACGLATLIGFGLCLLRSQLAAGVEPNNEPVSDRLTLG